jgi:hypothetical protein
LIGAGPEGCCVGYVYCVAGVAQCASPATQYIFCCIKLVLHIISGYKYFDTLVLQSAEHCCTSKISNVTFENDMDINLSMYEYTSVFIRMK